MSTNNLCFEQVYEKYPKFLSETFSFFWVGGVVKFSIYLNRCVFVMILSLPPIQEGQLSISGKRVCTSTG